jgi:3-hydroxyisobutyrate dehydrogenase-like beta-hydroxyacid dehydrogenase
MQLGFAGLGRMGSRMAANLVRAGHDVTVWTRDTAKARAFAQQHGCQSASSPRELAGRVLTIVTMLADDQASSAVHFAEDGLFSGNHALVVLEMGTISPAHVQELAASAPAGSRVIDAPVSGATQAAEDAKLMIMAGCDSDTVAAYASVFNALGRKTFALGTIGTGAVMKLAVNALIHGLNQGLAEAMTLTEGAGIDTETAFDVIENSAAAAPMLSYRRGQYLDEAANPVSFTVKLAQKDMAMLLQLDNNLGVEMPQAEITFDRLRRAGSQGYGARDMAAMLQFMKGNTPLKQPCSSVAGQATRPWILRPSIAIFWKTKGSRWSFMKAFPRWKTLKRWPIST